LTWSQVAAFRLDRHHLLERLPGTALLEAAADMGGAQTQLDSAARISLAARLDGLQAADVERALQERSLVKAACMRHTLFLVPAGELPVFARAAMHRAEKEVRWARNRGVPQQVLDAAIQAALAALDEPRTRPEIADRVCRALGVRTKSVHGGGWGSRRPLAAVPVGELDLPVVYLLQLAGSRGAICHGPRRGNEPTFVRADAWLPGWRDLPVDEAEDRLLRTYLRAFGPATAEDFALWSGLTQTLAGAVWERAAAGLAPVRVAGWQAFVLREDLETLAKTAPVRGNVRLLPYFDSFLLAHRDREHLVPVEFQPQVYKPQGWTAAAVLVDGRAVATWGHAIRSGRLTVTLSSFTELTKSARRGIESEAERLGRFLACGEVEVCLK
jgi:hypothetical protein